MISIASAELGAGLRKGLAVATVLLACHGCATVTNPDPRDPLESFNRGVFAFNEGLDQAIVKPVATMYRAVTPAPVRTGVGNFLGNLDDGWSFVNSLLQLKLRAAVDNFMRFAVNTTFGLFGVLDVASEMQIDRHSEDFGQTLGRWGVGSGAYLVLPVLGPSTLRDGLAAMVDYNHDIVAHSDVRTRNTVWALDLIDTRATLLDVSSTLDDVALDKYSFTRDAFLQRRQNAVYDGDPPDTEAGSGDRQ